MILFGFCSYFLKNPGKEWDTCVEEKKNKKEKTKIKNQKEDIERRRVGTCVKGKSPKKKKKKVLGWAKFITNHKDFDKF